MWEHVSQQAARSVEDARALEAQAGVRIPRPPFTGCVWQGALLPF